MSLINVTNVQVLDNPAKFSNPFQFEITFECVPPGIKEELEWKLVYVGSAEDEKYDQELDSVLVGPVSIGRNKFVFQAPAPNPDLIPLKDIMEVTVILLTCSYRDHEFIRIGYYVNNEYPEHEAELRQARQAYTEECSHLSISYTAACQEADAKGEPFPAMPPLPPAPPVDINRLQRNILADKPRVTRFQIAWDTPVVGYQMSAEDERKAAELAVAHENAVINGANAEAEAQQQAEEEEEAEAEDMDADMEEDEDDEKGELELGEDEDDEDDEELDKDGDIGPGNGEEQMN